MLKTAVYQKFRKLKTTLYANITKRQQISDKILLTPRV